MIASEASADKNVLSTERLLVSDIKNKSDIKSQAASLSLSYTSTKWDKPGGPVTPPDERKWAHTDTGGAIPLLLKESDSSKTRSAVSPGTIIVRDAAGTYDVVGLNRDTANANQHLDRPDERAMQERIDLIQSSAQLASSVINTVAKAKSDAAKAQAKKAEGGTPEQVAAANVALADAASWGVGGDKRIMADIATGLIAAGLGGAGAGTTVGIVANTTASDTFYKIGDYANQREVAATSASEKAAWAEGGAARVLLHTLAGAAIGLSSGSVQSSALGAGASAALMPIVEKALKNSVDDPRNLDAISSLIATGVGAGVGSGTGVAGAVAGGKSAANVDMFNRQMHPAEVMALKQQVSALATEAQITTAEAEKRLARGLVYYVDADWNKVVGAHQDQPDALTLKYLGIALAPLGAAYSEHVGSVVAESGKAYTPDETIRLLQNYRVNHTGEYNDPQVYGQYLVGKFDPIVSQQIDFYQNNLRYLPSLGDFLEGAGTGIPQGFGAGALATANGLLTLDKSLFNDFTGTTAQIAKGLVAWVSGQAPKNTEQDVQRFLYLLQGNEIASFRLETKIATELAFAMIPAGRVSAVGKVEELAKGAQGAAEVGSATKGSTGVPPLTSTKGPYSDGPFGEYPSGPVNFNGQAVEGVGDFSGGLGAKDTAKFFELATADDLALTRAKYNLPDGNTIGVARTDIPGFESEVVEGLSPVLRRNSGLPSLDELYGEARAIKSPYNNPLFTRHAEEDLFNNVANKIDRQGLTSVQLDGRVVDVKISNASGICNKCSAGLTGNSDLNGVVKQFSERYPTLLLRVTAEGGAAMPNRLTVLVKGGKIVNGQ